METITHEIKGNTFNFLNEYEYLEFMFDLEETKIEEYFCTSCGKEMYTIFEEIDECFLNGVVGKIECGYGSSYDGETITVYLCDECIERKIKK